MAAYVYGGNANFHDRRPPRSCMERALPFKYRALALARMLDCNVCFSLGHRGRFITNRVWPRTSWRALENAVHEKWVLGLGPARHGFGTRNLQETGKKPWKSDSLVISAPRQSLDLHLFYYVLCVLGHVYNSGGVHQPS